LSTCPHRTFNKRHAALLAFSTLEIKGETVSTLGSNEQGSLQFSLQTGPKGANSACMTDILDTGRVSQEEPKLIVRKAPHAPVWSVWAVLEGIPSEEIFEGSSEEEASSWIDTGGQAWLEERRRKRKA
jgi:hypothetical protein